MGYDSSFNLTFRKADGGKISLEEAKMINDAIVSMNDEPDEVSPSLKKDSEYPSSSVVIYFCETHWYDAKQDLDKFMSEHPEAAGVRHSDFIARMDLAYAMADVIISRSGASSISEICAARKAAVFVPSPNVAEDHQTHNAMALVNKGAALIVKDAEAVGKLLPTTLELLADPARIRAIEENAGQMAKMNAAQEIADEVYALLSKNN